MPKIIVTSRYLKCGSKKNIANYVKYVATREGSVAMKNIDENAHATKNQQELISSLLNDFPDSKELFEYEDYVKNLTSKTVQRSSPRSSTGIWTGLLTVKIMSAILRTVPVLSSLVHMDFSMKR